MKLTWCNASSKLVTIESANILSFTEKFGYYVIIQSYLAKYIKFFRAFCREDYAALLKINKVFRVLQ